MLKYNSKRKIILTTSIILIVLILSLGLITYALPKPFNGIIIKFENVPPNTKIAVQIEAFLPPEDPNKPSTRKTILITTINTKELRIPADSIKDILQGIINYEEKYKNIPHLAPANSLIINAWLLDENENIIDTVVDALPYNPQKLLNGGQEQKTIKFHPQTTTSTSKQPAEASCGPSYYWETQQIWNTSTKIPTLIIYNDYIYNSSTVAGSTAISVDYEVGFRLGFSIKVSDTASFSIPQIGDFTTKGSYSYGKIFNVGPGQTGWSWIEGSIVGGYYKEVKYCTLTGAKSYTGKEKVEVVVQPSFVGNYFKGGFEVRNDTDGSYYRSLLKYYKVKEEGPLKIPNTPVSDGYLNVSESLLFKDVATYYGFPGVGIGINAGKILVTLLALSTANPIVGVLAGLAVVLQYVDYTKVTIMTIIQNMGEYPSTSPYKSYNIWERLYVGVSSDSFYFVPSGTYIDIPYQVIRSF